MKRLSVYQFSVFNLVAVTTACLAGFVSNALADLQPSEIAIIAVRGSRESEGLAKYYAQQREIPARNICRIDVTKGEVLDREKWTWAVRPEIRKWLDENDPQEKIRCLVTTWDVPLKIGPRKPEPGSSADRYADFIQGEIDARMNRIRQAIAALDKVGGGTDSTPPPEGDSTAELSEIGKLQQHVEVTMKNAQRRVSSEVTGDLQKLAQQRLQQLVVGIGGANVMLQALNSQLERSPDAPAQVRSNFDLIRGRAAGLAEIRLLIDQQPPSIERDALLLSIIERGDGLLASVAWLEEQRETVKKNETGASFDSELSLLYWPENYELLRWQPNYLRATYGNSQLRDIYRTLMVARLDAPTIQLAKSIVDNSIAVEKSGLKGKVYIDARGLASMENRNVSPGSYADYDLALQVAAQGFREQMKMDVVLEATPKLFAAGECPDAALYCGWYSLGKYVDAFDWNQGAVAYHLASSEASTLRNPESQVWCKKLLEDGVCATIGPVYEPYLLAFPKPNEFLALLVQGELTLVECYYRTLPHNSWMMTLIGDPLYRPYKVK